MARQDRITSGARATAIFTENGHTKVVYHSTVVVDFWHDATGELFARKVRLNSGGWHTATTKTRMNQASGQFGLGYKVWQKGGEWFVTLADGRTVPFEDGMEFEVRG